MSEPKRRFFSGDSLQQALVQAANHYNIDPEEIAYRSIEKKHGFIKVRRKVVIEVDPEAPKRDKAAAAARPAPPASPPPPPPAPPAAEAAPRPAAPRTEPPRAPAAPERERRAPQDRRERRDDRPGRDNRRRDDRRGPAEGRGRSEDRLERGRREREEWRDRREAREQAPLREPAPPREPRFAPPPSAFVTAPETRFSPLPAFGSLVTLPDTPRRTAERFPPAEGPQAEAAARGAELLLRVAGLELAPRVLQGDERLEVDLSGPDVDWCFADDGELVLAVEHLLPRLIRTLSGEAILVRVDCDNFQEIREERLRSLAQRVAEEVRRLRKPRTLEPMNPGDRRIIHVTLADDPGVETESEGDGYFKRITVRPI
ncbi:MAG TPA: R3H domain-containing nucleic acid-binding protein [Thermoanaerobaculia bacterium]